MPDILWSLIGLVLFVAVVVALFSVSRVRNRAARAPSVESLAPEDLSSQNVSDRISEIERLRQQGLLTDDEYRLRRAELTGEGRDHERQLRVRTVSR